MTGQASYGILCLSTQCKALGARCSGREMMSRRKSWLLHALDKGWTVLFIVMNMSRVCQATNSLGGDAGVLGRRMARYESVMLILEIAPFFCWIVVPYVGLHFSSSCSCHAQRRLWLVVGFNELYHRLPTVLLVWCTSRYSFQVAQLFERRRKILVGNYGFGPPMALRVAAWTILAQKAGVLALCRTGRTGRTGLRPLFYSFKKKSRRGCLEDH